MVLIKKKKEAQTDISSGEQELQKALGLQDKFQLKGVLFFDFLKKNPKWMVGTLGLIALIFAVNLGYDFYANYRHEKASQAYFELQTYLEAQKTKETNEPVPSIQADHSTVGLFSALRLGGYYQSKGQFEKSIALYQGLLQDSSSVHLRTLAQLGLVYAYLGSGDFKQAGHYLELLQQENDNLGDLPLLEAYLLAKKEDAKEKQAELLLKIRSLPNKAQWNGLLSN